MKLNTCPLPHSYTRYNQHSRHSRMFPLRYHRNHAFHHLQTDRPEQHTDTYNTQCEASCVRFAYNCICTSCDTESVARVEIVRVTIRVGYTLIPASVHIAVYGSLRNVHHRSDSQRTYFGIFSEFPMLVTSILPLGVSQMQWLGSLVAFVHTLS